MNIFLAEEKKLFTINKGGICIVIALILQIAFSCLVYSVEKEYDYSPKIYKKYCEKYEGKYSEDIRDELIQIRTEYSKTIENYEIVSKEYLDGEIPLSEYNSYYKDYMIATSEISTIEHLIKKCEYFDKVSGFQEEIFYDTNLQEFVSKSGIDIIIFLLVLVLMLNHFDCEFSSKSITMILTSKDGAKKVYINKMLVGMLNVFLLSLIFLGIDLGIYTLKYEAENMNNSIGCIIGFENISQLSIYSYILVEMLIKAVTWSILAVLICMISIIFKNIFATAFVSFVAIYIPGILFESIKIGKIGYLFGSTAVSTCIMDESDVFTIIFSGVLKIIVYLSVGYYLWKKKKS